MYVKYCENKPKSESIVAEFTDTYFEVSKEIQASVGLCFTIFDLECPYLLTPGTRIFLRQFCQILTLSLAQTHCLILYCFPCSTGNPTETGSSFTAARFTH